VSSEPGAAQRDEPKFIELNNESEPYLLKKGDLLVARTGATFGKTMLFDEDYPAVFASYLIRLRFPADILLPEFYWYFAQSEKYWEQARNLATGGGQPQFNGNALTQIKIPLPPLEVQKGIVAEIDGYQKVIDGARSVLDHYRPHIPVHPDWPMVPLGDICLVGGIITTDVDMSLPYFGADSIESNTGKLVKIETAGSQRVNGPVYSFSGERLLYSKIRPYLNKLTVIDLNGYCSSDMYPLVPDSSKVLINFLATYMLSDAFNESIRGYYERANIPKINRAQLFETKIPLPQLATQQSIVAEIKAEHALVAANRELVTRFENKIKATLARIWGEDEKSLARGLVDG
jgi:type I restriction enzyme M protein